jgi:class 3 adenylate cyclase
MRKPSKYEVGAEESAPRGADKKVFDPYVVPQEPGEVSVTSAAARPVGRGYDDPRIASYDVYRRLMRDEEFSPTVPRALFKDGEWSGQKVGPLAQPPLVILFTDMEGSTSLIERVGDEKAQQLLRIHNRIVRGCLRMYHGHEVKHTGDGVMASFPSASAAIGCAIAIQKALALHNRKHPDAPIRVRIGTNAGEPIAEEGQLFGAAVNAAARICARALPGQILVSDVVRQLVAGKGIAFVSRGRLALKGFAERFRVYEVQWEEGCA